MCLGDQLDLSEDTTTVGKKKQRLSCWEALFYLSCFYLPSCCWNKSTVEFICLSSRNPRIKSIWNWSSETSWYTKALWQSKVSSANLQVGQIYVMFHRVTVYQWISVLIPKEIKEDALFPPVLSFHLKIGLTAVEAHYSCKGCVRWHSKCFN